MVNLAKVYNSYPAFSETALIALKTNSITSHYLVIFHMQATLHKYSFSSSVLWMA